MDFGQLFLSNEALTKYFFIGLTLLITIIIDLFLRSLIKLPKNIENRKARTATMFFRNFVTVMIYIIAANIILVELGINLTPLLASASIMGIIIGISLRNLVEDFISGLFMLSQDTVIIGDYIKVDDIEGTVEAIGFRAITIKQQDGSRCVIPNGQVKRFINYSRHRASVLIDFPIKADQKIKKVKSAFNEALEEFKKDKRFEGIIIQGTGITGIEEIKATGPMVFRVTIVVPPSMRLEAGRAYREYAKKACEKYRIAFG
ncbi:MAG: mechanosensitive ion channel domain-containing protein [Patescibacteria group bacterium]